MMSSVDIHNTKKEEIEKSNNNMLEEPKNGAQAKYFCSLKQLLIIVIPMTVVFLFAIIFIPIYVVEKNNKDDDKEAVSNNNYYTESKEEYDQFEINVYSGINATMTPLDGYDNILIFLGGISDVSDKYFDFFESKNSFIPKGTKIYSLSGPPRQMQFMIDYYHYSDPVPGWFNIGADANLVPDNDFTQAKDSLEYVLNEIDRIKNFENIAYKNIYLAGFSQGAMMTNYILLNSRHELGGYIAFSGYVFDHDFSDNQLILNLEEKHLEKLQKRENYHILATHSYKDSKVPYANAAPSYEHYYQNYTDFKLLCFGLLDHVFPEQPIHPYVKQWLKESMGK